MTAYLVNIALLFFWACLLLWIKPDAVKKKAYCVIASTQWILLSGLRHVSVGADTLAYKLYRFDPILSMSWADALGAAWDTYFGPLSVKDPGFWVVVKLLQVLSHDYQVFLFLVAVLFTVPLGVFIYKRSDNPFISFLIYSCLFSSFFAITGIRQTIATALVVLIGYRFVEKRELVPFLALSLVAFTIHKSAIVFVPFYFMAAWNTSPRKQAAWVLLFTPLIYLLRHPIIGLFGDALGYEQYTDQFAGAGTWMFSAMLVLVVLVAFWRSSDVLRNRSEARMWFPAVFAALGLTPMTFVDPNAMRIVQYYSFFLLLLVPSVLRSFRDKNERALAYTVAVSLLILLFVRTNPQYLFFWQAS